MMKVFKNIIYGKAPKIVRKGIITGRYSPETKRRITTRLNQLLDSYDFIKVGKTGSPEVRVDQKDYRGTYQKMILLYKSKSDVNISNYEREYINRFYDDLENVSKASGGKMRSYNGFYYLYVVVKNN